MKKLISLALAAIMLAAALIGCATAPKQTSDTNITVTSSDAKDAAAWLTERLGTLPGRVVIGTDASAYGVDVSALEKDGYIIRDLGGETALFARTASGLDRAVRKYAKTVESGAPVEDTTYHEGYRVKRLTIAGNASSEYAVVCADGASECLYTAAGELVNYIEMTCGTRLARYDKSEYDAAAEKPARKIILTEGDGSLGQEGFTITVDEAGDLHFDGGIYRGALYGVWDFIEENLGWRFLGNYFIPSDKREYLYESDHIDVTADINRTETPDIPIIRAGGAGPARLKHTYALDSNKSAFGSYGWARATCHGLQAYHSQIFSGEYEDLYKGCYVTGQQPCFSNEEILEAIDAFALRFVKERLDAGQQIGKDLVSLDLGHWDAMYYSHCECKDCLKVRVEEGSRSGTVVRMGNRVCALFDEYYPGMCASVFGYAGTEKPCKTHPAHNLYVSFCYHVGSGDRVSCQNHCLSGEECAKAPGTTNYLAAKELEGWAQIMDPYMLQVWMYPSNCGIYSFNAPLYRNALKDCRYLRSVGVSQLFIDSEWIDDGVVNEELTMYLYLHFAWECDVTEDDELAMIREWLELVYGKDSGDLLYEVVMLAEIAGDRVGCWSSLGSTTTFDHEFISEYADQIWEYCDLALALAEDSEAETLIERFIAGYRYMTLLSCYDDMYTNGTAEQRDFITAIYRSVWDTFKKYNLPTHGGLDRDKWRYLPDCEFDPDVHPQRWLEDYDNVDWTPES